MTKIPKLIIRKVNFIISEILKLFKYLIKIPESNEISSKIATALENYKPCSQENCSCHIDTLRGNLKPFKAGITKEMLDSVRDKGTKYQIIDHKLYRDKVCMFPARCNGNEYFIKQHLPKLPDMEMIINSRDWPQINTNWGNLKKGPVLSFSKTNEYQDIMYPTWGFWEGGPAISLYPTGLGRWDQHRISIKKASEKYPWEDKKDLGFFRGSRTSGERDPLILLSRKKMDLVDAQYTKNQAWKSPADTLNADPAKEVSLEDHCQYKYLFNFRGVAASFRLKHLFLCKSLVFHVGDEWQEFFYESLKPWVHYIPIKSNPSLEELEKMLLFFKEHDDLAKEIAERGFNHIWNNLRMKDVSCYWRKLLKSYAKLIKFDVTLDKNLIKL